MTKTSLVNNGMPLPLRRILQTMGENCALARKRRDMTQDEAGRRVFVYLYGSTLGVPAGRLEFVDQTTMRFAYGRFSTTPNQAMSVGRNGSEGSLANALTMPEVFGLTRSAAEAVINSMLLKLPQWKEYFDDAGVSEQDMLQFENSFETRWVESVAEAHLASKRP